MTYVKRYVVCAALVVFASSAAAVVWRVPGHADEIQTMIGDPRVVDGDTISVWGPEGVPPPYTYEENVDFLGKRLFLVNRSFLPGEVPYDSSWEHVTIDGRQLGTTVRIYGVLGTEPAVLKGLTITGGRNNLDYGGGIDCRSASLAVVKSRIYGNRARVRGGGVFWLGVGAKRAEFVGNLIEGNEVPEGNGGGLFVECWSSLSPPVTIYANVVRENSAVWCGGGMYLWRVTGSSIPPPPAGIASIADNVVSDNVLTAANPDERYGGGIFLGGGNWLGSARRNVVTDNTKHGIADRNASGGPLNLGEAGDPGMNVLMRNGDYDLYVDVAALEIPAVGNYWGYLDTPTILSRIYCYRPLLYDPVAASGKWFNVSANSLCETDVIITGDLRVEPSVELRIAPGRKFEFVLDPDTSLPGGGDVSLTDLILAGSGSSLQAIGTAEDSIYFTSWRHMEPHVPGDWYGIRLKPGSNASLAYCDVNSGYCGIDAEPGAFLDVVSSYVHGNLCSGVNMAWASGRISHSDIMYNEVNGIDFDMQGIVVEVSVADNHITHNGVNGIVAKGTALDAPCSIFRNTIESGLVGPVAAVHGIRLEDADAALAMEWNTVVGFHQAAIGAARSSTPMRYNHLLSTRFDGLFCTEGSSPVVRWNTIDGNEVGVKCELESYPDLGTEAAAGNNSILMGNTVWVANYNNDEVRAELNWWGTDEPDEYDKFIGSVDYVPWLTEPPGGEGGQSAGSSRMPMVTKLGECWPNPVAGRGRIAYQIGAAGVVSLRVHDASGRLVRTLCSGLRQPGFYTATWEGTDSRGRQVPSGVYFYRLNAPGASGVKKAVVMR